MRTTISARHSSKPTKTRAALIGTLLAGFTLGTPGLATAQEPDFQGTPASNGVYPENASATFPLVFCWYKGRVLFYIQIDTSDKATAEQKGLNYVPQLANVLTTSPAAYDDIYTVTNYTQFNVVPSAPDPVGPKNTDRTYQPLWQVSEVSWNAGSKPRTLRSEEEILSARDGGEVTIKKTTVVINCPIIFRPGAGKLPNIKINLGGHDKDGGRG